VSVSCCALFWHQGAWFTWVVAKQKLACLLLMRIRCMLLITSLDPLQMDSLGMSRAITDNSNFLLSKLATDLHLLGSCCQLTKRMFFCDLSDIWGYYMYVSLFVSAVFYVNFELKKVRHQVFVLMWPKIWWHIWLVINLQWNFHYRFHVTLPTQFISIPVAGEVVRCKY